MITSEGEEQVIFVALLGKGYRATLQGVGKLYILHTYTQLYSKISILYVL